MTDNRALGLLCVAIVFFNCVFGVHQHASKSDEVDGNRVVFESSPTLRNGDDDVKEENVFNEISPSQPTHSSAADREENSDGGLFTFTKTFYNVSIPENSRIKTYVTVVTPHAGRLGPVSGPDPGGGTDVAPYAKMGIYVDDLDYNVRYKIVDGDEGKVFKAESYRVGDFVFLMIRTRSADSLNREYLDRFRLTVRATITSNKDDNFKRRTKCEVYVQIEDVNDLIPYFYVTEYDISVPEDTAIDSNLVRVAAFDADAGLNGEVYYSLESTDLTVNEMFAVHPTMGIVTNTRRFYSNENEGKIGENRTTQREYLLTIVAFDRASNLQKSNSNFNAKSRPPKSKANIRIRVEPVNKYEPTIVVHSSLITSASNNSKVSSFDVSPFVYGVVSVTDGDGDDTTFGKICSLSIINGNDLDLFQISNSSVSTRQYYIELKRPYSLSSSAANNKTLKTSLFSSVPIFPRINNEYGLEFNLTLKAEDCGGLFSTKSATVILNPFSANATFSLLSIIQLVKPSFKKEQYYIEISEVALIGSQVIQVEVDIPLRLETSAALPLISFTILEGNEQQAFGVTPNGVIYTRKTLDFEQQKEYTIVVGAHLRTAANGAAIISSAVSTTRVHIKLFDENDNSPQFQNKTFKFLSSSPLVASLSLEENKPIGSLVCKVSAVDLDSAENGLISYSLENTNAVPFAINQANGKIRTTEVLDYESGPRQYLLIVRATDWGSPFRRKADLLINVTVRDINDHRPQFEKRDCTAFIPRNTKPWTEIFTLSAIDFDAQSLVTYKMANNGNSDELSDCFSLEEVTGVLRLKCSLKELTSIDAEKESAKETFVNVTATDGQHFADVMPIKVIVTDSSVPLSADDEQRTQYSHKRRGVAGGILVDCKGDSFSLGINEKIKKYVFRDDTSFVVKDIEADDFKGSQQNQYKPIINPNTPEQMHIPENIARGAVILKLAAEDGDEGLNSWLRWTLNVHQHESNETGFRLKTMPFNVEMFTGNLIVIDTIDRELQSEYKLNLTVCDLGSPQQLCSSRDLKIFIDDENDNPPKFDVSTYYFSVPEDTKSGSTIGRLHAFDADSGRNSILTYSLRNHRKHFAIDSKTGSLIIKQKLDREEMEKYKLHVAVHDNGTKPLSATATVIVEVKDVNDNPPRFREPYYLIRIREDLPFGTVVTKINAFDLDSGENGHIEYLLMTTGNEESRFSIDRLTGNVRIVKDLDFEDKQLYNLTITAKDKGTPSLSSNVYVLVEVEDVDENVLPPRFPEILETGDILENSPPGTLVMTVTAFDDDAPPGYSGDRSVLYQIVDGDGIGRFTIDSSGNVFTTSVLDRETSWRHWLTVVARDRSAVPKSSHVHLFIEVIDENDNAPITAEPFYVTQVFENASISTPVIQLSASDADLNDDSSAYIFRILNEAEDCAFRIDSKTGLIETKAQLDHETQAQYILDIEISENREDNSVPVLKSRTPVVINVLDVNDNAPLFHQSIFWCNAYDNLNISIPICQVIARDSDNIGNELFKSDNGKITFRISDGNENEFFRIDESTGAIYLTNSSVRKGKYDFNIEASDGGFPSKSSQSKVLIEIFDHKKEDIENNTAPVFSEGELDANFAVSENEAIGAIIAIINPTDAENDKVCVHILSGNDDGVFAYLNGALLVAKRIDFETKTKYVLTIMITDGVNSTITNTTVNIIDTNDNIPRFEQDLYIVNVHENATKGTEILSLDVFDIDTNDNHAYSLYTSGSPKTLTKFEVESWSGKVRIKESLDHETCRQHIFVVEATDSRLITAGRSSSRFSRMSHDDSVPTVTPFSAASHRTFSKIVVNVLDVNDHAPQFISPSFEAKMQIQAIML
ncbi:fat-like cadherin-related tumor suppressor isoform X4 [Leptotrombidium deliense]|uniref:Fat-like cadherin-related tumor suppressor isoform X4 n=1 Tax=Leptotrombidium deliense TaxID=299467 RepID=A0A443SWE3_9ACAR|nr:fat-like cadherin-related tumor suppressor isoform X4 [Leptotrombidium deliense]